MDKGRRRDTVLPGFQQSCQQSSFSQASEAAKMSTVGKLSVFIRFKVWRRAEQNLTGGDV